ncbi:MAG: transposase family protein, partial [Cyanobacteria bacterium P01_G01_bin.54]
MSQRSRSTCSKGEKEAQEREDKKILHPWLEQFAEIEDPRGKKGIQHPLLSIVMIAILAVIGGATGWEDIETYGESHEAWLSTF